MPNFMLGGRGDRAIHLASPIRLLNHRENQRKYEKEIRGQASTRGTRGVPVPVILLIGVFRAISLSGAIRVTMKA